MKKQIHLLIENLFDDLYDIDQENNLTIDVADKIYKYEVGTIYYKDKKPYAICASTENSLQDFEQRFILITKEFPKLKWSENRIDYNDFNYENYHQFDDIIDDIESREDNYDKNDPDQRRYFGFNIKRGWTDFLEIDEKGYENTQMIKNNFDLSKFPAFEYCCKLGDDVYLPAIDELQIMYVLKDKLKSEYFLPKYNYIWSSSVLTYDCPYYLFYSKNEGGVYNHYIYSEYKVFNVLPFVKIY